MSQSQALSRPLPSALESNSSDLAARTQSCKTGVPLTQKETRVDAIQTEALSQISSTASSRGFLGNRVSKEIADNFLSGLTKAASSVVDKNKPQPEKHWRDNMREGRGHAIINLSHATGATAEYDSRIRKELDNSKHSHDKKQTVLECLREISKVTGDEKEIFLKDHPELQNRLEQVREHYPSLQHRDKWTRDELDELRDVVKDIRDELIVKMSNSRSHLDNHMGEKIRWISGISKMVQMHNNAANTILHNIAPR